MRKMNEKSKLMNAFAAEQFAAWELHLYLDTHCSDKTAMRLYEKHSARAMELKEEYESKFGPITSSAGECCRWVKEPWPWEKGG